MNKSNYNRKYHQAHKEEAKARKLRYWKERVEEVASLIIAAKSQPCMDCGHTFHPVAMDFDHVRGKKKCEISQMIQRRYSKEAILEEMAKCDVVCACCHRIRTFRRKRSSPDRSFTIYESCT